MPLLLAALLPLLSPLNAAPPGALQDKPVGVLLLGEGGSPEWDRTVADLRRVFSDRTPFEFAALADGRDMQRGIDALARQRVKTIVLVPLAIFAFGEEMDETRYLLGISKRPPAGDAAQPLAQARLNSPCPLVLARPLEADPIFVDLLASRAKPLSREPSGEALLLVGQAPERLDARARWLASASDLAEKVRQRAGLAGAGAYALRSALPEEQIELSRAGLRRKVRELRQAYGAVLIVPLALTTMDTDQMRLAEAVDGLFARYDGKTILPDARIARWTEQSVALAAELPVLRLPAGATGASPAPSPLAAPPPLNHSPIEPPPALARPGEQNHD